MSKNTLDRARRITFEPLESRCLLSAGSPEAELSGFRAEDIVRQALETARYAES